MNPAPPVTRIAAMSHSYRGLAVVTDAITTSGRSDVDHRLVLHAVPRHDRQRRNCLEYQAMPHTDLRCAAQIGRDRQGSQVAAESVLPVG